MGEEVVVIAVHGMGDTQEDFADELRESLADELGSSDWAKVHFDTIYYQGVLQPNQKAVMRRMRSQELDWLRIRRFLLYGFSDAAGLERAAHRPNSPYAQVQRIIRDTLERAFDFIGGSRPVVVVAQSLGGQVMSNYLWDAQQGGGASRGVWRHSTTNTQRDDFLRLKKLRYFYTTGCNIPIFLAGFPQGQIKPVKTASSGYAFRWKNFYDEDDALGWPLKPLSPAYRKAIHGDYKVNAGGSLIGHVTQSWNPFSHGGYWTDKQVIKPLTRDIRSLFA